MKQDLETRLADRLAGWARLVPPAVLQAFWRGGMPVCIVCDRTGRIGALGVYVTGELAFVGTEWQLLARLQCPLVDGEVWLGFCRPCADQGIDRYRLGLLVELRLHQARGWN